MKKIISIVGTRPQFLKLAPICRQLHNFPQFKHLIIHTGQHYDNNLSQKLFQSIGIPKPEYFLGICRSSHAQLTGQMMIAIEQILIYEKPDCVLVYGDCDTTLAGALTTKKLTIPLVHIESGMRSSNKNMPEEINRILTDHISDLLLCSTLDSINNLNNEGLTNNIHFVGNLQLELLSICIDNSHTSTHILDKNGLISNNYILLTLHRHYNTTHEKIRLFFFQLEQLLHKKNLPSKVIFPIHPRTKKIIDEYQITVPKNIQLIDPVDYFEMIVLEKNCWMILTDSGGVQPEAWYFGKKCLVLRSETEWIEPIINHNNRLYDCDNNQSLLSVIDEFLLQPSKPFKGELHSSMLILSIIDGFISKIK